MRFVVGEVVVDVIVDDDDFHLPLCEFLPGLELAALGEHRGLLEPEFIDLARNTLKCAIQSFVLQVAGRTLLVDTCIGEHKDRPEIPTWNQRSDTGFLERLRRAGVEPAAVDTVFCTHLHIDHVGWNTRRADGRWVPTFPNARYLVGRTELADWLARRDAGTAPAMHLQGLEDSVLPVVEAGLVDLVDDGHELARGLGSHGPARTHRGPDGAADRPPGRPGHLLRRRGAQPGADRPAGGLDLVLHRATARRRDPAPPARRSRREPPAGGAGAFSRPAQGVCPRDRHRFHADLPGRIGLGRRRRRASQLLLEPARLGFDAAGKSLDHPKVTP
jgi:Metallo-beta-lactamase superfamily